MKNAPSPPSSHTDPLAALKQIWGHDAFRPLQQQAVDAAMARRDTLVVLPTGGGKSLCYQLPAACGSGLVVVISPLIALMDDQVAAARQLGLRAAALHSHTDDRHRQSIRHDLRQGHVDLLYLSPERLVMSDVLVSLSPRLALLAVDEAHCVSHWGHEFRPEYRQLAPFFDTVPACPRMALTATATPRVQDDVVAMLGLRQPLRLVGHVDRPNLLYRALPRQDQARQVLDVVTRYPGQGGIVYAQTRAEVERLAASLAKAGISCAPYHAGLDPAHRRKTQHDFVHEQLDVVVATIAFGMGIDRPNVRFVVHANTPRSIEHYQQESGRAGRDGLPAECVLLFSGGDLAKHRAMSAHDGPLPPERAQALETQLHDIGLYAVAPICRHRQLTEHFAQPYPSAPAAPPASPAPNSPPAADPCGACDVCLGQVQELPAPQALLTAQKIISAVWRTGGRFGRGYVAKLLLGKADERMTRRGHDQWRVFGILADAGPRAVSAWIDQLLVQGMLCVVVEDLMPLLAMTDAGRDLCRNIGSVRLSVPPPKPTRKRDRSRPDSRTPSDDPTPLAPAQQATFDRLRLLRKLLAAKQSLPPYVIFHDSVLRAMTQDQPASLPALRSIRGIGDRKLQKYGPIFLRALAGEDPHSLANELSPESPPEE
ncbi:MAG: RecQ family ATP-dependent DNA helicase [Phycisphaeraceae bacterium]|nr:RecQ family ATP-dependent DNA helicase [Phycisphaeraceae bacterium]